MMRGSTDRSRAWASTMSGHGEEFVHAHSELRSQIESGDVRNRVIREAEEAATLRPGAALAIGAGVRPREEEPDPHRTCFERDRDRIVHSSAFRRLAGKTQVVVFPTDHQRTRLTHALEVAQVARSIAAGIGANVTLADAIALGHDCGHGPGGHASETAFDAYLPEGFDHGPWGADVALAGLNLCEETSDGIRNHSWSRPAPNTIEGEIVSWADRIAYCAHDLEDAVRAGVVGLDDVPGDVASICGVTRSDQLGVFGAELIETTTRTGRVQMRAPVAGALAGLRQFNYDHIYTRAESEAQYAAVVEVLKALVDFYLEHPDKVPPSQIFPDDQLRTVIAYVGGMTDRFAFQQAVDLLGWPVDKLPRAA